VRLRVPGSAFVGGVVLCGAAMPVPGRLAGQSRFFPAVPSFEMPLASPRATAITGRLIKATRGDSRFGAGREAEVAIGEDFPVLALRRGPRPISLGFGTVVYGRFSLDDKRSSLISNDWTVGINTAVNLGAWDLIFQVYHESSHLGDEYRDTFNATRLDWTREVGVGWLSYSTARWRFMTGLSYVLIDGLDLRRPGISGAVDYRGRTFHIIGQPALPIAGVFLDSYAGTDWKPSTSTKFGLAFPGIRSGRELRLSFITHGGLSTQRQFFRERSRYFGLELQFNL
ncbi:MAG: DUF1207 domain-containing protein, partial [Gemmatimonadales bacterium]